MKKTAKKLYGDGSDAYNYRHKTRQVLKFMHWEEEK